MILERRLMLSRRDFLQAGAAGLSFVSLAGGVPRLLARAAEESANAEANDHVLVVVELAGGNDGLNTLVPFEDPLYYKNRPTLGIPKDQALKLTDLAGLHPQMAPLAEQFKEGRLAVIQGVGYPQPDRSHFRSMEIWHTASTASAVPPTGWLGRALDQITPADSDALSGLALTGSLPQAFQADRVVVPVVGQLENVAQVGEEASPRDKLLRKLSTGGSASATPVAFMRQQAQAVYRAAERLQQARAQYQSTVEYPETSLGQQLQQAARIIAANIGTRILFVSQDGYDTHSDQAGSHAQLMEDLAGSLAAFQQDLAQLKADGQVATMVFSEFGRRVDENGSQGTDHGAAGAMFVMGSRIKGGLYGQPPSLAELGDGDLIFNTDFRTVYTPLLDTWLGCPAEKLLGEKFAPLDILA
jgi:uncharacterized protein (DUF1501 family)